MWDFVVVVGGGAVMLFSRMSNHDGTRGTGRIVGVRFLSGQSLHWRLNRRLLYRFDGHISAMTSRNAGLSDIFFSRMTVT